MAFGEYVLYQVPEGRLSRDLKGKLSARWRPGIFLGHSKDSPEYILWDIDSKTVQASRALNRAPEDERWAVAHVEAINIRPKDTLHRAAWQAGTRRERQLRLGRAPDASDEVHLRGAKF